MKIVIANHDVNDPADTKEISPVDLDLDFDIPQDDINPLAPAFSAHIALAVVEADKAWDKEAFNSKRRLAQASIDREMRVMAARIKEKYGLSLGYQKPWVYKPKTKAAYGLWKRLLPLFVQNKVVLDMGPTKLVVWLNGNGPSDAVTRDMLYDTLNAFTKRDAIKLFKSVGVTLPFHEPVTLRSLQKELIEQRVIASGLEADEFAGKFAIRGDTAYVNGKPYKIQPNKSGKPRIKIGGRDWLPLDTLRAFCSV